MSDTERVLVFPVAAFPTLPTSGFSYTRFSYLDSILHWSFFMTRELAEKDERYKQIIPYILFRHRENEIFSYARTATYGAAELAGQRSIGVGGHLNAGDFGGGRNVNISGLLRGAMREADEEFLFSMPTETRVVGIINENWSPISRVHLGVVLEYILPNKTIHSAEPENHEHLAWIMIDELNSIQDMYEGWSRYIIQQYLTW